MEKIFEEAKMYTYLRGYLQGAKLNESVKALSYARDKHSEQLRKDGTPYIVHPLTMACHAASMGLVNDVLFCAILLHDVVEDCGVKIVDLPFSIEVKEAVELLTFDVLPGRDKATEKGIYYEKILNNPIATLAKIIDRCHNVSSMAGTFTRKKLTDYIVETKEYVLPLLRHAKDLYPEYSNELYILKYHIISVIGSISATLDVS